MIYSKSPYTVSVRHPLHEHFRSWPAFSASDAAQLARKYKEEGYQVVIRENF